VGCRLLGFPEIWIDFFVFYTSSTFFRMDGMKQRTAMAPTNSGLTHYHLEIKKFRDLDLLSCLAVVVNNTGPLSYPMNSRPWYVAGEI
jgi:hypothetical protein